MTATVCVAGRRADGRLHVEWYTTGPGVTWLPKWVDADIKKKKSKPLLPWRLCSGYAHGRPWVYIGMSDREQFETTADPDVFKVELTTNPGLVLHPTLSAYRLMVDVVRLIEQRRR